MREERSRGRPRTFDREAVLDAAVDEFWRHGYEGVSISDLTSALGCTAPTLYSLFGSKEGLFQEALARYVGRGFAARAELMVGDSPLYSRLEAVLRATVAAVTSEDHPKGCLVLSGGLAVGSTGTTAAAALGSLRTAGLAVMRQHLAQARDAGDLPTGTDIEGLARFYLAVLQGLSAQAVDGATREQLERLVDAALAAWPGKR